MQPLGLSTVCLCRVRSGHRGGGAGSSDFIGNQWRRAVDEAHSVVRDRVQDTLRIPEQQLRATAGRHTSTDVSGVLGKPARPVPATDFQHWLRACGAPTSPSAQATTMRLLRCDFYGTAVYRQVL